MPHFLPTRRHALASLLACGLGARAAELGEPQGTVVLTVSGAIARTNLPGRADFDLPMLQALPQQALATATPWHPGVQRFSGPRLRELLAHVGAQGRKLVAVALNDYRAEIPLEDAARFEVIVALARNGQPMRVRDKGPLFIVYPYDQHAELRADRYYARSVWQLRSLIVQ